MDEPFGALDHYARVLGWHRQDEMRRGEAGGEYRRQCVHMR